MKLPALAAWMGVGVTYKKSCAERGADTGSREEYSQKRPSSSKNDALKGQRFESSERFYITDFQIVGCCY